MSKIIILSSKLSAFLKRFERGSSDKWQQTMCTSRGEENGLNLSYTAATLCTASFEINTYTIRNNTVLLQAYLKT